MSRAFALSLVGVLVVACGEKKPSGAVPASNAPLAPVSASIPPPSSAAAAAGSHAPPGAPLVPLTIVQCPTARLAIVFSGDAAQATIFNAVTDEWRLVKQRREGESTVLEAPGVIFTLAGADEERRLSVRFGEAPARTFNTMPLQPHSPTATAAYSLQGELLSPDTLDASVKLGLGRTSMIWRNGLLPVSPSLPAPIKLTLGGRKIVPGALTLRHEGVCSVVGLTPTTDGPLGEALGTAQKTELDKLCRGRTEPTLVELSYAFVRFRGVPVDKGDPLPATDVVGLNWLFRVTDARGSSITDTGYLVGMAKDEVVSLVSLLNPTGAALLLKKALGPSAESRRTLLGIPAPERAALLDLSTATLSLGSGSLDLVVAAEPLGIFLEAHRVRLWERSKLSLAFVKGPLTARLTSPEDDAWLTPF